MTNPVRQAIRSHREHWGRSLIGRLALVVASIVLPGCELDSFFNPSVTGYWEHTPTTIPILDRIDAIEQDDDFWGQTTDATSEDLIPSDLSYRTAPGDAITISIFELYLPGTWSSSTRRVDPAGFVRVPELGDVPAAGRTPQEIQDALEEILRQGYLTRPQVDVVMEESGAFTYTVLGSVPSPGLYTLRKPDLSLLDALAIAGGGSPLIDWIYIVRRVQLTEDVKPRFDRDIVPVRPEVQPNAAPPPVDIEDLIDDLENEPPPPGGGVGGGAGVSPGAMRQDSDPIIDIDDLQPVRTPGQPEVDVDDLRSRPDRTGGTRGTWVFLEERGEWVRVPSDEIPPEAMPPTPSGESPSYVERIIKIPNQRLIHGDSKFNVVVRPNDRIYVEPPPVGVVYIDGQIQRAGTFNLPASGITLSRLVAAAGGLGQLAIPERVDLVRKVGPRREAAMRLDLAAIRHRTEPDVLLKPDDHIIIGTSWVATPLAIIRNGFRATYGFGFLLDRNFGNDVFGPPPTSNFFN